MDDRRRAINHALLVAFGIVLIGVSWDAEGWGVDARAYWAIDLSDPYSVTWSQRGAFAYSPVFAQVVGTVSRLVPVEVFLAAWTVGALAVLGWLGGRWAALLLLFPPVALEIWYGNVHLLLATAIALGFRWPVAWAFVLLTKVTPGVGLVWFAVRREWCALGMALGATALIAGISYILAPWHWHEWISFLADEAVRPKVASMGELFLGPLWLRITVGAVIAALGGWLGYRWPVAVAAMVAMPAVWVHSPALLVAVVPLAITDRREPLERVGLALAWLGPRRRAVVGPGSHLGVQAPHGDQTPAAPPPPRDLEWPGS
jgi:hypothetical protein